MQFTFKEILTPKGQKRFHLRVWKFGPENQEFTRRFPSRKALMNGIDDLKLLETKAFLPEPQNLDPFFFELVEDFFSRQAVSFSPGWRRNLNTYWEQLRGVLEKKRASQVDNNLLKTLEHGLLAKGGSQRTANMKLQFVRSVISFAHTVNKNLENNVSDFKFTKCAETDVGYWEKEDALEFLSAMRSKYQNTPNEWRFLVYLLAINCGLRAGEIWALKPRCLRFERGLIHIDEQFDRVEKKFTSPKGKGPRNVPMNDELRRTLKAFLEKRYVKRHDLLFPNEVGKPIDHDNFYERIFKKEFGTKKGQWAGPKITFHGLRHTSATLMLNAGLDVKTVQEILGHKDIETTMRYVHALSTSVERAAKVFSIFPKLERRFHVVKDE